MADPQEAGAQATPAITTESEPSFKRQRLSNPGEVPPSTIAEILNSAKESTSSDSGAKSESNVKNGSAFNGDSDINRSEPDSREAEAGIIHFVNTSNPGFCGTLKQRYTDFLVHEITPDGTVVHLTDVSVPKVQGGNRAQAENDEAPAAVIESPATKVEPTIVEAEPSNEVETKPSAAAPEPTEVDTPENRELFTSYFGADMTQKIFTMYDAILANPTAKAGTFGEIVSEVISDRPLRGAIHMNIRRIFNSRLETVSDSTGKITVHAARPINPRAAAKPRAPNPRTQNQNGMAKGKVGWNELGGQHLHFTLYKENKDTMEVIGHISRSLKVKPRDFNFAGTKDRRAVTTQRVSVLKQTANTMAKINRNLRQARVGNFKHEKFGLELGELQGNQFTITLRDCHFSGEEGLDNAARLALARDVVGDSIVHLQADGFINYFGMQRFGTFGIGTDVIGKKILQEDFEGAVWAILSYSDESLAYALQEKPTTDRVNKDDVDRARAIHFFKQDGNGRAALDRLPRRFSGETSIIRALTPHNNKKEKERDYLGALLAISRNLRTMYVHAYQSKVWNLAASERWSRYGLKVVEGDLVLIETPAAIAASTRDEVDENGEVVVHPAAGDEGYTQNDIYQRARALTSEEAASGKYTIYDIVLPTPGFDIQYPLNDIGDFYKEWMGSDAGGKLDPANMRRRNKDFSLSGSYRKFMAKVGKDLTFEARTYHDESEQMVETDAEILDKKNPPRENGRNDRQLNNSREAGKPKEGTSSTHAHNAWSNAAETIAAQDKAANEAAKLVTALPGGLPQMRETFVEASVLDGENRTTAKGATIIHGSTIASGEVQPGAVSSMAPPPPPPTPAMATNEASRKIEVAPIESLKNLEKAAKRMPSNASFASSVDLDEGGAPLNSPAASSFSETTAAVQGGDVEMSGGHLANIKEEENSSSLKRRAEDISEGNSASANTEANESPARIGIIVKFQLGSSQYATMALRELMKAGGVKTYKPDYSNAR